ncbi:DNA-binding CsgD family transcriptional regulator/PAS domain-containing protein [Sinorhizobium kostiense]|uniref:DNA-binding CsgD family transcriptional regulator/PAS domain-containing protein n=1 Tax=Sinorhizobium kostiense TaxID=76747 RepID=A0ABS4QX79_9HYPH|nr:helix-turn-helix transcriptional regulator [Sinorhizobium kostiense]MBP2235258.1 DNA-binding CsgD family transcriptional regulator/PAS domain-containing protein [Sinorhizobium kostiense]
MDIELLGKASDLLFEASIGITPWHDALDVFAQGGGAAGANALPIRAQVPGSIEATHNAREMTEFYLRNELYKTCIRSRGIPALERKGIMTDKDCATEEEYRTDPYYQEFLRPHGFFWGAYVGFNIDNDLYAILLNRGLNHAPFSDEEQAVLRRFRTQMSVAGTVARKLAHAKIDAMRDAFDLVDVAGLFFDRAGNIIRVNAKAETMFTHGISLRQGQISTPRSGDGARVKTAACNAILSLSGTANGDGLIRLARDGKRDLVLKIHRLRGNLLDIFNTGWALGILVDPDENQRPDDLRVARTLFGLTGTEAKIASLLATGKELSHVADICNVTYETARTHLRAIFAKTDTSRQGQLIALLNRLD